MAIQFDSVNFFESALIDTNLTNPETHTQSITVANNPNRVMVLAIDARPFGTMTTMTSVSFNGATGFVSLGVQNSSTPLAASQILYKVAPDVGTFTLSFTSPAIRLRFKFTVRVYYGVHQSTPFGTASLGTGSTTPASLTPASALGDTVLDTLFVNKIGNIASAGAGQTQRYLSDIGTGGNSQQGTHAGSDKNGDATSTTMTWTVTTANEWAMIAAAMKPADVVTSLMPWIGDME
jgi:hypothetical protein